MNNNKDLKKRVKNKFNSIETNLKISFANIKKDFEELKLSTIEQTKISEERLEKELIKMKKQMELMSDFIKKKEKRDEYSHKKEKKIRDQFENNVDEFNQKTKQLSIALSTVRDIKENVVTKKDLAQIEEKIRQGFKEEIEVFKSEIREFKKELNQISNGKDNKKTFFSFLKGKSNNNSQ
jgi:chromosome segregation ATPase